MIKRKLLEWSDEFIYNFLRKNVNIMPIRFCKFIAVYYTDARIRKLYWEKMGVKFGENSFSNIEFNIISNKNTNINVTIGNNVSIARNCTLIVDSIPNNSNLLCSNYLLKKSIFIDGYIIIEDDVWIGANTIIFPNVTIKKGSIIGAGSIVLNNTEEFSIYAGVPAKKIKNIN